MAYEGHGAESLDAGRKVRSAGAGRGRRWRPRQNNDWESLRDCVSSCHHHQPGFERNGGRGE